MKYKVGSMFAGIGGICLGFKQAGAEIIWANEVDSYACKTYRENFGNGYLIEEDIRCVDTKDIPDIDILTAGFPCQSFSIAGYGKGLDDERGNLFYDIIRVLKQKKPMAFLLENVKNLASHDKGRTFEIIKTELKNIGYEMKYKVLNSSDYGDVPQNRERIYIVGFRNASVLNYFSFPKTIPRVSDIDSVINRTDKVDDKYYYSNDSKYYRMLSETIDSKDTFYQIRRVYIRKNQKNICPTLTANMGTGGHNVPLIVDDFGYRKLTPRECLNLQGFPKDFKIPNKMSNGRIYKQAGNSVTVSVVKNIAKEMIKAMDSIQ